MHRRRVHLALTLVATGLVASGCGAATTGQSAGDFSGEAKGVAMTLDDLERLGRDRDADAICSRVLAARLVAEIKKAGSTSCPTAVDDVLKDVNAFDLRLEGKDAISVSDATATARVTTDSGDRERVERLGLVREAGRWKLLTLRP